MNERFPLVNKLSMGSRELIWNPLGWHFRAGERLASVLVPSKRDVTAGNSQVLERIGIDLLEKQLWDAKSYDG